MYVSRIFFQLFLDRFSDPVLHLCCRRFCKCHNQKSVHIDRTLLICDLLNNTFYENGCLSRSCRRRYKNITISQIYDLFAAVLSISRPFLSFPAFPALLVFRSVLADIFFQSLPHLFSPHRLKNISPACGNYILQDADRTHIYLCTDSNHIL